MSDSNDKNNKPTDSDFNFRIPSNLTKQLAQITQGVAKMYDSLYSEELKKLTENAVRVQQNLIKSLNLIDTNKILEGVKRIAESAAKFADGISAHLPDNWPSRKLQESASLCIQGVPIIFVPRAAIIKKLLNKDMPSIKRVIAHNNNAPLIIEDCKKALDDCEWLSKDMREHIRESIVCFENGQYRAAQSTAIIAFDSLLNDVIDMSPYRKKNKKMLAYSKVKKYTGWTDGIDLMEVPLGHVPFYTVLMLPIIGHMLVDFDIGDKATHLNDANRHASSHTIGSRQYKKSNALLTIMAVVSICKVTQLNGRWWLQKVSEQYNTD